MAVRGGEGTRHASPGSVPSVIRLSEPKEIRMVVAYFQAMSPIIIVQMSPQAILCRISCQRVMRAV